jgi:hypothetical protein
MGGAAAIAGYQDSQASATYTLYQGTTSVSWPVTLKSKGTQESRSDTQKSSGTVTRIVNQGQGVIERPDGTVQWLITNNTLAEYVSFIPLLSILSNYQTAATVQLVYQGVTQVNGQNADAIAVSYVPTTDPVQGPVYASMTQIVFYVDQSTSVIDEIQYTNYSENDSTTQSITVFYSNYQSVNGMLVPYSQTTYADGTLESMLTINSITFNVGLSDSDFNLPSH